MPRCTVAYNSVKLQRKIIMYLITWDVGNVILLYPHISDIFLGNVHLHALIHLLKSQFHTWYLLSILLCGGLRFLSMGHLKNKLYATNPHTLEELKASIRCEIDYFGRWINAHFLKICQKFVDEGEQHFRHLMLSSSSVFCPRAGPSLQTQAPRLQFCPKAGLPLQTQKPRLQFTRDE